MYIKITNINNFYLIAINFIEYYKAAYYLSNSKLYLLIPILLFNKKFFIFSIITY